MIGIASCEVLYSSEPQKTSTISRCNGAGTKLKIISGFQECKPLKGSHKCLDPEYLVIHFTVHAIQPSRGLADLPA